jgi:hypothetical protein
MQNRAGSTVLTFNPGKLSILAYLGTKIVTNTLEDMFLYAKSIFVTAPSRYQKMYNAFWSWEMMLLLLYKVGNIFIFLIPFNFFVNSLVFCIVLYILFFFFYLYFFGGHYCYCSPSGFETPALRHITIPSGRPLFSADWTAAEFTVTALRAASELPHPTMYHYILVRAPISHWEPP